MYNTTNAVELQYLDDRSASGRQRPWRVHKLSNQLLSVAYEDVDAAKAARLRDCATELSFAVSADGKKALKSANFCRVRLCPMCQWRRSLKVYGQVRNIMNAIAADEPKAYIFVTFTVRNCGADRLSATLDRMSSAWNRMVGRKPFKSAVKGYYRGLEITHNTDIKSADFDTYHPHFHCVFAVNRSYFTDRTYLSQARWTELWKDSLRIDYNPIVDVRKVKGDTALAVAEAAKYSVKTSDYIIPDDWDLTVNTVSILDKVLDRRRLVAFGGIMADYHRKLNLDDAENGDLVYLTDDDKIEQGAYKVWYVWRTGYNQYVAE